MHRDKIQKMINRIAAMEIGGSGLGGSGSEGSGSGGSSNAEKDAEQDLLIATKIDRIVYLGHNVPVTNGEADLPIAHSSEEQLNPKYVGRWPSLAAINAGANPNELHYVGKFAYNDGTTPPGVATIQAGELSYNASQILTRQEAAYTGTAFSRIEFTTTQLPTSPLNLNTVLIIYRYDQAAGASDNTVTHMKLEV
jgi:hypothetical protein